MKRRPLRKDREPTITLINVVFLMLVFFLVAGTIAAPVQGDVNLVSTADLDAAQAMDAFVLHSDGRLTFGGIAADPTTAAIDGTVRIVPDREAPAAVLVHIANAFRSAGADAVLIVTERALK